MKTLDTVVWTDEIEMYAFSNENLLVDGGLRITAANDVIIQYFIPEIKPKVTKYLSKGDI